MELEAKVPMDAYTQWTNKKANMKVLGKTPNLDNFCEFNEKLVIRQSDARYVRNTMDSLNNNTKDSNEEQRKDTRKQHSATLLHSSSKENKDRENKKNKEKYRSAENNVGNIDAIPIKGSFKSSYFIFCECKGHTALYCKNWKLTFDEKKEREGEREEEREIF